MSSDAPSDVHAERKRPKCAAERWCCEPVVDLPDDHPAWRATGGFYVCAKHAVLLSADAAECA